MRCVLAAARLSAQDTCGCDGPRDGAWLSEGRWGSGDRWGSEGCWPGGCQPPAGGPDGPVRSGVAGGSEAC